jgi:homoaconitase/3-isopropylmalate dehydratase large subunit
MTISRTLYDKVFSQHIVQEMQDSTFLIYIDRSAD